MAEKKVIDIEVKSNIQKTINELNSLETNLEDVRDEAGKTSKSIDDVAGNGGAIAILDQLTGGLASQFKNAYESTKLFNLSLKGTKSALIATGIGALVVALGAIVAYWDDIVEFVNGTNKALQKQNELLKQNTDFLDARLKTVETEKKSLEAQGKSTKEIIKLQNSLLTQKKELLKLQLINLETQLKEEESVVKKVSLWEKIKVSALTAAGLYKEAANASVESVIGNDEERKSINDKKIAIEQLKTSLAELTLAQIELNNIDKGEEKKDRQIGQTVGELSPAGLAEIENAKIVSDSVLSIKKNQLDKEKALELTKLAFKNEIFNKEADLAIAFGGILQQIGEKNKSFAIAGIIVEQVAGAAKAIQSNVVANAKAVAEFPLTFGQPWVTLNTLTTGLGIASGALAAKKAISQLGGGGSIQSPQRLSTSGGGASAQAPSFNIVGQSGINQLSEAIGTQESKPIKAYVTSNDVTTAQGLDRNIVQGATIG